MHLRRLSILVYAGALGATVGAVAWTQLGGWSWIGEVLSNLALQLALASALVAVGALFLPISLSRRCLWFGVGALLAVIQALPLVPYVARAPPPAKAERPPIRLLVANLHSWAVDVAALEKLLRESGADIVLMTEITPDQQSAFNAVSELYPHQFQTPRSQDNTYTVRILARRPFEVALFHSTDHPVLQAKLCRAPTKCLAVLSAHAPRPGPGGRDDRNAVLDTLVMQAKAAASRGDDVIVAGDFNITAFSPDFKTFKAAGLSDSALGRGYPSTWPLWLGGWGIGIDHVLVSSGVGVTRRWLGPDIHSDHLPLFVELAVLE
jgi:endonuclease/exonuclease/phosphatase (EEP) superfamily protein YafD